MYQSFRHKKILILHKSLGTKHIEPNILYTLWKHIANSKKKNITLHFCILHKKLRSIGNK